MYSISKFNAYSSTFTTPTHQAGYVHILPYVSRIHPILILKPSKKFLTSHHQLKSKKKKKHWKFKKFPPYKTKEKTPHHLMPIPDKWSFNHRPNQNIHMIPSTFPQSCNHITLKPRNRPRIQTVSCTARINAWTNDRKPFLSRNRDGLETGTVGAGIRFSGEMDRFPMSGGEEKGTVTVEEVREDLENEESEWKWVCVFANIFG